MYICLRTCVSVIKLKSNNRVFEYSRRLLLTRTVHQSFNNMASEKGKDSVEVKGEFKHTASSFRNWVTGE